MDLEIFRDYCLSKLAAIESTPFGEDVLVFKVAGKIFALAPLDANHLRAKLAQRHAAQRRGDETRHLHHGQAAQRQLVHVDATRSKTAASPCPPPMHMVTSP